MENQRTRVLFVDDEEGVRAGFSLQARAANKAWDVETADSAAAAIARLTDAGTDYFDVVVVDMAMETEMAGLDVVRHVNETDPMAATQVVVLTRFGSIEKAVAAMEQGAYSYVEKQAGQTPGLMLTIVERAASLCSERRLLRQVLDDNIREAERIAGLLREQAVMLRRGLEILGRTRSH